MIGVNLDGVIDRFKGLLELKDVLYLETIEARFNEHDLKEIIYLLDELKYILKGGEIVLSDQFFTEYSKTGPPPQEAAAADDPDKMYTAAEVDKLVADKVEAAVKEIKESMNKPDDIPAANESEE